MSTSASSSSTSPSDSTPSVSGLSQKSTSPSEPDAAELWNKIKDNPAAQFVFSLFQWQATKKAEQNVDFQKLTDAEKEAKIDDIFEDKCRRLHGLLVQVKDKPFGDLDEDEGTPEGAARSKTMTLCSRARMSAMANQHLTNVQAAGLIEEKSSWNSKENAGAAILPPLHGCMLNDNAYRVSHGIHSLADIAGEMSRMSVEDRSRIEAGFSKAFRDMSTTVQGWIEHDKVTTPWRVGDKTPRSTTYLDKDGKWTSCQTVSILGPPSDFNSGRAGSNPYVESQRSHISGKRRSAIEPLFGDAPGSAFPSKYSQPDQMVQASPPATIQTNPDPQASTASPSGYIPNTSNPTTSTVFNSIQGVKSPSSTSTPGLLTNGQSDTAVSSPPSQSTQITPEVQNTIDKLKRSWLDRQEGQTFKRSCATEASPPNSLATMQPQTAVY
jgi:hypothetical protein